MADRSARNTELVFSLDDSGTGVSQVVAILTAVVTSSSSVIVIDEINSFLHPSAVRKLLSICRTFYPEHQYIVSSHSSEVLTYEGVDQVLLVERSGFTSSVTSLDRDNVSDVRRALKHIGVGMMDVLGSDRVVWVEGPTEEVCFPLALRMTGIGKPPGLTFMSLASTGDFSRRGSTKKAVVNIYEAAIKAVAPLVEGTAFSLDRERLSAESAEDIERQTDGRLLLLPRRNLECYFIHPEAIRAIINEEAPWLSLSKADVQAKIEDVATEQSSGGGKHWKGDIFSKSWLERVDGAYILKRCFAEATGTLLEYSKTVHGPQIMSRIDPVDLLELSQYVQKLVSAAGAKL